MPSEQPTGEDTSMPTTCGEGELRDRPTTRFGLPPSIEYWIHRVELCLMVCKDVSVHDLREIVAGTKRLKVVEQDDTK